MKVAGVLAPIACLCVGLAFVALVPPRSQEGRFEGDFGVELPDGAFDVDASGNASVPIMTWLEIDRSAATTFTISRSAFEQFSSEFNFGPMDNDPVRRSRFPSNDPDSERYLTFSAPNGSDYTLMQVTELANDRLQIWLHSDWN